MVSRETQEALCVVGIVSFFITYISGILWWVDRRSNAILQKWAGECGLEITGTERRYLSIGPFKWWSNNGRRTIYLLTVRDQKGQHRTCWARCGGSLGGVYFSDKIEIKWVEP